MLYEVLTLYKLKHYFFQSFLGLPLIIQMSCVPQGIEEHANPQDTYSDSHCRKEMTMIFSRKLI